MQFQLPTDLQAQLISYDSTLKKLAQANKPATSKAKKSKYPVGLPPRLLPSDVIRDSLYNDAIDYINSNPAPQRFHEFKQMVGNIPQVNYVTHAVIYHWEGLWVAAWLSPKGQEDQYIYGYTHCYKDTATTRKMLPYSIATNTSFLREQVGRSFYCIQTKHVTKQNIIDGDSHRHWSQCNYYGQKGRYMGDAVKRWESQLRSTIPTWEDSMGIFDRIKEGPTAFAALFPYRMPEQGLTQYWTACLERYNMTQETWLPTTNSIFTLIDIFTTHTPEFTFSESLQTLKRVRHIIDKPFFRKWIQSKCDEIVTIFNDPEIKQRKKVCAPFQQIITLARGIQYVNNIWPDAPIDYYQSHIDSLIGVRHDYSLTSSTEEWLRQHMTVETYFHIHCKHYLETLNTTLEEESSKSRRSYYYNDALRTHQFRFNEWDDTINMLNKIFQAQMTVTPPKRWRITEFHDHVQTEAWKIQNPNQSLTQDLFPQPIKVEHDSNKWTFFQPIDTHQLSAWGKAVRNCVGNASSYAEGVNKKQHFIVLGMLDGQPTFTIQLKVNMGVMSVEQIVGFANARLDEQTRAAYTEVFRSALHIRDEQLRSNC